jgi:hypothetical protein
LLSWFLIKTEVKKESHGKPQGIKSELYQFIRRKRQGIRTVEVKAYFQPVLSDPKQTANSSGISKPM